MASPVVKRQGQIVGFRDSGIVHGLTHGQASRVWWNDAPLRQAGVKAFRAASADVRGAAVAKAPASRIRRTIVLQFFTGGARTLTNLVAIVRASHPLAHLFEGGAGPHIIAPQAIKSAAGALTPSVTKAGNLRRIKGFTKSRGFEGKKALKFTAGDGGFSRGPVRHPGMKKQPFMGPAAAIFAARFRAHLSRLL